MPHKSKHKQAAPPPQAPSSSRRFSFNWFSDTEAFLVEALARADTSSAGAGGGTPPQLPSPLLESMPLPSAVLGPEFRRLDQAFATVDLRFLNFESDEDAVEEGGSSPPPPAPSAAGVSGDMSPSPGVVEVPVGPPPPQDAPHLGDTLSDAEIERRVEAALGPLYPPPPPAPYTDGAPGVRAVEHMLLTAGHWLATVDVSSVPLHEQQGLFGLAAAAFVVAGQRFPSARTHEPSCPLSHEADTMPPSSPVGGVPASHIGSPTASGSGPTGHVSSTPSVRPRRRGRPAKR
jgi:hypothetical protein